MADFAAVKKALLDTGTLVGISVEEAIMAIVLEIAPELIKPVDQTPVTPTAPAVTETVEPTPAA